MSMRSDWIDRIFTKLSLRYGTQFMRKYEGLEIQDVKAEWADELSGFGERADAVRYAFDHLPADQPPNIMQFKALCNSAPRPEQPMLPAPKADQAIAAAAIRAAQEIAHMGSAKQIGNKDWAWRMRDRELNHGGELESGCTMRQFHRDAWRYALKHGKYAPINTESEEKENA